MAIYYSPRIITDGLMLAIDAANIKSYPGTGVTWTDLTRNTSGGTLVGVNTFSSNPDRFDTNVVDINTTGHLLVSTSIPFADTVPYTFDFMVKLRSEAPTTFHSLTGIGGTVSWLTLYPTTIAGVSWNIRYRQFNGVYENSSNLFYDLQNNWGNITLSVQSDREIRIFLNGEYQTSIFPTTTQFTVSRIAGGYSSGGIFYDFQGSIAMYKLYNRALNDDEVFQNFNAIRGRFGL